MNQIIRILAADGLKKILSTSGGQYISDIYYMSDNEPNPIGIISKLCPDIVIMNMFTQHYDAISVIDYYCEIFGRTSASFIVVCSSMSEELKDELTHCKSNNVISAPCEAYAIQKSIKTIIQRSQLNTRFGHHNELAAIHKIHDCKTENSLDEEVEFILNELGFYAEYSGYEYLKSAIVIAVNNQDAMYSITHTIYPIIAAIYHTTSSSVERKIHSTINRVWNQSGNEILADYFGSTINIERGKPSNCEFIAAIADRIRITARIQ